MGDQQLIRDLRRLCKGRGLLSQDFVTRLGPALLQRLRDDGLGDAEAHSRTAVRAWLETWLVRLPDDLAFAARVAFGLDPRVGDRFLTNRVEWLAGALDRDTRTVRRRIDEAVGLLAEYMMGEEEPVPGPPAAERNGPGWYFAGIRALVRLGPPQLEVIEERRIVVTAPHLDCLTIEVSLPRPPGSEAPGELLADVLYGGVMRLRERPSASHFRFVIELSRGLATGEQHELGIRYGFPPNQPLAPHYALVPLVRCDHFELRLKAPAQARPGELWTLDGVPTRTLDDPPPSGPDAAFDRAGEARAEFSALALGHAYGFRWAPG